MNPKIGITLAILSATEAGILWNQHGINSSLRLDLEKRTQELELSKMKLAEIGNKLSIDESKLQGHRAQLHEELQKIRQTIHNSWILLQELRQDIINSQTQLKPEDHDLAEHIQREKDVVTDLQQRLKDIQAAQKNLSAQSLEAMKSNKLQLTYQIQSLNTEIQGKEQLIHATNDQLSFWRRRRGDAEQASKVEFYQQQLVTQQQGLAQLRSRRVSLSQAEQNQNYDIKVDISQQIAQLKSNEDQTKQQIKLNEQDIKSLQDQQRSFSQSNNELKSKIQRLEQEYHEKYANYQNLILLESKKQAELNSANL